MYNRVVLVGNLTRDIELRYTSSGLAIANSAIATSRKFRKQNGEQSEEVMFIDITFFARSAEIANQYLRKGSKILVEGRLNFEQWTDNSSGQKRSKHSVTVENMQMLDTKNSTNQAPQRDYGQQPNSNSYPSNSNYQNNSYNSEEAKKPSMPQNTIPEIDIDEDEIPF